MLGCWVALRRWVRCGTSVLGSVWYFGVGLGVGFGGFSSVLCSATALRTFGAGIGQDLFQQLWAVSGVQDSVCSGFFFRHFLVFFSAMRTVGVVGEQSGITRVRWAAAFFFRRFFFFDNGQRRTVGVVGRYKLVAASLGTF